jgi:hypothetical protein
MRVISVLFAFFIFACVSAETPSLPFPQIDAGSPNTALIRVSITRWTCSENCQKLSSINRIDSALFAPNDQGGGLFWFHTNGVVIWNGALSASGSNCWTMSFADADISAGSCMQNQILKGIISYKAGTYIFEGTAF